MAETDITNIVLPDGTICYLRDTRYVELEEKKQDVLTAGEGISIVDGVISLNLNNADITQY